MILSDVSVKRPVLATVISLLIVVIGIASLLRLPVREYPNIDPPVISITTTYTGAAPEVVDTEITELVESAISSVDGIRLINSESRDGRAQTTVEFHLSRDVDAAANDVRDALGRIANNLPEEADAPVVRKTEADARPMMWLSMVSDTLPPEELTDFARRNLVDRFAVIEGVARVDLGGERQYAMRVWLDREALAARALTVADIEAALREGNLELPAGRVESTLRELTLRTATRLRTPEEFADLVVSRVGEYQVRLGEVARVERAAADERTIVRVNGRNGLGLGIVRQSQANVIQVSDLVRAELDRLMATLPDGLEIVVAYDESLFVREAVREVMRTLAVAIGLVILIILIFLRTVRATFVPAVTIPVSLVGAFSAMLLLGFSINVLTLLALVLAVGLVVDDAIVMIENIQRRIEEGEPRLLAAFNGARQVGFAIVATTLSLVAVFVPLAFMEGNVGRLFVEFGLVMAAAVIVSSIVALTLAPMLCSRWLRRESGAAQGLFRLSEAGVGGMTRGYRWLLGRAVELPVAILAAAVLVGAAAWQLIGLLPQELVPVEDRGVFIVPSRAPEGATPEATSRSVRELEQGLMGLVESGEAQRVFSIVGFGGQVSRGFTIVGLAPWHERERHQAEIVGASFPHILSVPGLTAFAVNPPGLGQSPFQQPVQVVIGGADYASLRDWRDRILERARANPGLINPNSDYEETRPQLTVEIDRRRAADLGIAPAAIARTIQTMFASREVGSFIDRGREYDVILQADRGDRASPAALESTFVRTRGGELVPLASLVTLREQGASPRLQRIDRLPSLTITASLAPGYDLGSALAFFEEVAAEVLPSDARLTYLGQSLEFMETTGAIYVTFALALLVVFLVLAAQFESFIHPLIILLAVPLAVTGALLGLLLTGISLNIYSQIGMILLIGLLSKNGILVVEFANQLRDQGRTVREAILEAAELRFRPILMTAISTVVGAMPLVLASGAGAESRAAIGIVVVSGLAFATLLTLFVVPVLYDLLARFTRPANAVAEELARLGAEARPGE